MVGLWSTSTVDWVIPFTAGGFVYVAAGPFASLTGCPDRSRGPDRGLLVGFGHGAVGIIPTLLLDPSPMQSVYEVTAMLCGMASMLAIALAE